MGGRKKLRSGIWRVIRGEWIRQRKISDACSYISNNISLAIYYSLHWRPSWRARFFNKLCCNLHFIKISRDYSLGQAKHMHRRSYHWSRIDRNNRSYSFNSRRSWRNFILIFRAIRLKLGMNLGMIYILIPRAVTVCLFCSRRIRKQRLC